ncbi:MAG: NUDIX domain-containing protein [Erysipelotrichaceae bacterium]|nr:NUDIX domain-containing protein [Erysipelotrichaceae bacterium]
MPKIFTREELIEIIKESQKCLKVVETVIFDLPINDLKDFWFTKIDSGNYVLEFICESEPTLSYNALISSNRRISGESRSYEFGEFKTIQEAPLKKLKDYLEKRNCRHLEPEKDAVKYYLEELKINNIEEWKSEKVKIETGNFDYSNFKQCFYIRTCYIPFSVPFIQIDNRFFITYSLTKFCSALKFEEITENHIWYDEFKKYFNVFLENPLGAKKYSTEETKKGNKLEVIQMYNGLRQPLGLLPRDSFLEGTRVKVVIWGLIFTRDGKLLIHQRSKNAKDNQGMWDKSVGGHVDINDIDTVKAAAREMAEELFKNEN